MPAFIRDESRPRAAGAGEIGFRLLELVARDHIVELAPAEEDRLVEQAVVRQVAVLYREAAADYDQAAICTRNVEQKSGRHRGAVAATACQPRLTTGSRVDHMDAPHPQRP